MPVSVYWNPSLVVVALPDTLVGPTLVNTLLRPDVVFAPFVVLNVTPSLSLAVRLASTMTVSMSTCSGILSSWSRIFRMIAAFSGAVTMMREFVFWSAMAVTWFDRSRVLTS